MTAFGPRTRNSTVPSCRPSRTNLNAVAPTPLKSGICETWYSGEFSSTGGSAAFAAAAGAAAGAFGGPAAAGAFGAPGAPGGFGAPGAEGGFGPAPGGDGG